MRTIWLLLLILILMPVVFAQQSVNRQVTPTTTSSSTSNPEQVFEKFVVKEHFLTRNEIKAYIDDAGLQFEVMVNGVVANSFQEFDSLLNRKIRMFVMKLIMGIFGVMIFTGSLWFFVSYKLNQKKEKILALQDEIVVKKNDSESSNSEVIVDTKKEKEPVTEDLSKAKKSDSLEIEVKTEESTEKVVEPIKPEDVPKPSLEETDLKKKFYLDVMNAKSKKEVKQLKKRYLKEVKEQYQMIAGF